MNGYESVSVVYENIFSFTGFNLASVDFKLIKVSARPHRCVCTP